jgi:hypothetical protein
MFTDDTHGSTVTIKTCLVGCPKVTLGTLLYCCLLWNDKARAK